MSCACRQKCALEEHDDVTGTPCGRSRTTQRGACRDRESALNWVPLPEREAVTAGPEGLAPGPGDLASGPGPAPTGPPVPGAPGPVWPSGAPGLDAAPGPPGTEGYEEQEEEEEEEGALMVRRASRTSRSLDWLRQVSFRGRVSVLVGVAVGIAVALTATVSYFAVSRQLQQQANNTLERGISQVPSSVRVNTFTGAVDENLLVNLQVSTGDQVQVLVNTPSGIQVYSVQTQRTPAGPVAQLAQARIFPIDANVKAAFTGGPSVKPVAERVTAVGGHDHYLVATVGVVPGSLAVEVGFQVTGLQRTLAFLRFMLVLVAIGGVALAAALGWAVGRASMGPVEELTLAAEHVAETQDLTATIDDSSNDELGRLARSFNAMLNALSNSRSQQAQLVSDAGHELRTPLTSLRTNIEVLMRAKNLSGPDRDELLSDIDAQLQELTNLVGDLVDLAREDERQQPEPEPVELHRVVARAVERAQRRAMSVAFDVSLEEGYVRAQPALLERAVMNVLDNAAKWSPRGGRVSVTLRASDAWHLVVQDQGPGIDPGDLPHIFERFYRAQTARSMPGSGLGLAIVKGVVSTHGGRIDVGAADGGGTRVEIVLPLDTSVDGLAPDDPGPGEAGAAGSSEQALWAPSPSAATNGHASAPPGGPAPAAPRQTGGDAAADPVQRPGPGTAPATGGGPTGSSVDAAAATWGRPGNQG